ncbi:cell division protein FtsL [Rhodovulum tesquicola]|uniref:cell division protein FtsL n=1 Tax=Rhodovulum tesquicola TaxID=540254 RepID=UPI0020968827|nr:cell division protein FtsL [Rhodovulum tesquicola]MCO8145954.1 cell division protein FtsL [Rhodovulum tesquicola]
MRGLFYVLTALAVMGLAVWAYRENYATQQVIAEVERLNRDIGLWRERRAILNAEWAYLNRPDRLRALANLNFERLELLPLAPEQFAAIDQVAYPTFELPEIVIPIELLGSLLADEDLESQP